MRGENENRNSTTACFIYVHKLNALSRLRKQQICF